MVGSGAKEGQDVFAYVGSYTVENKVRDGL